MFIVIGLGKDRKQALIDLDEAWPGIEVIAPVEKRMIRPRRKTTKEPLWIERPLFMEYAAVPFMDDWRRLFTMERVTFVLGAVECPTTLSRTELGGMIAESKKRDWEGEMVEVVTGPLKGSIGIYERGHIRVSMFGGQVKVKVSTHDLSLA